MHIVDLRWYPRAIDSGDVERHIIQLTNRQRLHSRRRQLRPQFYSVGHRLQSVSVLHPWT